MKNKMSFADDLTDYCIRGMVRHTVLSKTEAWEIAKKRRKAQGNSAARLAARNELIEHNTLLVVLIAKNYKGYGLPIPDLLQEGNLGLIKAAQKFDERFRVTFPTYATRWIRQKISRALTNQTHTVRLPVHTVEYFRHIRHFIEDAAYEGEAQPTAEDIAAALDIPLHFVERFLLTHGSATTVSLDAPAGIDGEGLDLDEMIPDERAESPRAQADRAVLFERLRLALKELKLRERTIVELRFGLNNGVPRTLEEVGAKFKITRERVRQIQAKALQKLRKHRLLEFILGDSELSPTAFWSPELYRTLCPL